MKSHVNEMLSAENEVYQLEKCLGAGCQRYTSGNNKKSAVF